MALGGPLAALLPDLLVFRKPRGSEPELATAQGVLLGVHVTGEGEGRRVALLPCQTRAAWASAPSGRHGYGLGPAGRAKVQRAASAGNLEGHFQSSRTPVGMIRLSP